MKPILDLAQQNQVCQIVAIGASLETAAALVGCTDRTIRNMADRDPQFRGRLEQAELEPALLCLRTMSESLHDPKNWRAAACMLKFLCPQRKVCGAKRVPIEEVKIALWEFVEEVNSLVTDEGTRKKIVREIQNIVRTLPSEDFHTRLESFMSKKSRKSSGDFQ